jgi:hypothetical protein
MGGIFQFPFTTMSLMVIPPNPKNSEGPDDALAPRDFTAIGKLVVRIEHGGEVNPHAAPLHGSNDPVAPSSQELRQFTGWTIVLLCHKLLAKRCKLSDNRTNFRSRKRVEVHP